jgi:hypothetical protein
MTPRSLAGACMLGGYLLVMGFLGGTLYSAIRFDARRAVVLSDFEKASNRLRAKLMRLEQEAAQSATAR